MDIIIIVLLILLNGVFAMAEIAIISARKSRLRQLGDEGNKNAQAALELANNPNRFLSTVQIGITLIGILAGAFAGETIVDPLSAQMSSLPMLGPYSDVIALGIVVAAITYMSLIIGELVPKRIALNKPEKIAMFISRPMNTMSALTAPLVTLLTSSTDLVLRILRMKQRPGGLTISDEEVKALIREGARVGVFEIAEKEIVERTLRLGDRKVSSLMTPNKDIVWLKIDSSFSQIRNKIQKRTFSYYPVYKDNLKQVMGVVRTEDFLAHYLSDEKIDLSNFLHKALFIQQSMDGIDALELFKEAKIHTGLVVDEYENIKGILTLTDILEAIVGDMPAAYGVQEKA